jgi:hypothetical protein
MTSLQLILRLSLAFIVSGWTGFCLVRRLSARWNPRLPGMLIVTLGLGAGLGIDGLLFFCWRAAGGSVGPIYSAVEIALALGASFLLIAKSPPVARGDGASENPRGLEQLNAPPARRLRRFIAVLVLAAVAIGVVRYEHLSAGVARDSGGFGKKCVGGGWS